MNKKLRDKLRRIRILALDFDGTLTDGFVYFGQDDMEMVRCSRRDSLGINLLQAAGVRVVILSKETNRVVVARAKKMRVDCHHGIDSGEEKAHMLTRYAETHGVPLDEVAYMGDDINDLECIQLVGVGVTVADGHPDCKNAALYTTQRNGGDHAVREVCDLILKAKS